MKLIIAHRFHFSTLLCPQPSTKFFNYMHMVKSCTLLTLAQNPNLMLNHYLRSFPLTPRWKGPKVEGMWPIVDFPTGSSPRPLGPILQPNCRFKLGFLFGWHLHSLATFHLARSWTQLGTWCHATHATIESSHGGLDIGFD